MGGNGEVGQLCKVTELTGFEPYTPSRSVWSQDLCFPQGHIILSQKVPGCHIRWHMVKTAYWTGLPCVVRTRSQGTNAQALPGGPASSELSGYELVKLIAGAWLGWGREEREKDTLCLRTKINHLSNPFLSHVLKYNMTWRNANVMSTWESNHLRVNGRQLMAKEQIGNCWMLWILTTHITFRLLLASWHENTHDW